jgi:hypothetical protein
VAFGVRGSVVGHGAMVQGTRLWVPIRMRSLDSFNLPNPSSRTMALRFTQQPTEMSTKNIHWGVKPKVGFRIAYDLRLYGFKLIPCVMLQI